MQDIKFRSGVIESSNNHVLVYITNLLLTGDIRGGVPVCNSRLGNVCCTGRDGGDDITATRSGKNGSPLPTGGFNVL